MTYLEHKALCDELDRRMAGVSGLDYKQMKQFWHEYCNLLDIPHDDPVYDEERMKETIHQLSEELKAKGYKRARIEKTVTSEMRKRRMEFILA